MGVWVDTDFGFDDLWAILLLGSENITIDGISLVAGNAPLEQVRRNAVGARDVFAADWPLFQGANKPLIREQDTAVRILGPRGMQSRGYHLPNGPTQTLAPFVPAIRAWLNDGPSRRDVLALGPMTNLAILWRDAPDAFAKIDRIVWMGGASARGNHSPHAEFNALADPEAAALVLGSGVKVDIVDLEICRSVQFSDKDLPTDLSPLLRDLLGGYLDIALSRGRAEMAIYDPLAALALACPGSVAFAPMGVSVDFSASDMYGKTTFVPAPDSAVCKAVSTIPDAATRCLAALGKVCS